MRYHIPVKIEVIVKIDGYSEQNQDLPNTLAQAREEVREYLDSLIKSHPRFGAYSITIPGEQS